MPKTRREWILEILSDGKTVSANTLAAMLQVSRQAILNEIALLRALDYEIVATPKGYRLGQRSLPNGVTKQIRVRHAPEQTREELYLITDQGGAVLDVSVRHRTLGNLTGEVRVYSRYDADRFLERSKNIPLLCGITGGSHTHTIWGADKNVLERVEAALRKRGFLAEKEDT